MDGPIDPARSLPEFWRNDVQSQLHDGERLLAWFEPDLDQRLIYAKRLVVLTDRRLLGYGEIETTIRPHANGSAVYGAPPRRSRRLAETGYQRDNGTCH